MLHELVTGCITYLIITVGNDRFRFIIIGEVNNEWLSIAIKWSCMDLWGFNAVTNRCTNSICTFQYEADYQICWTFAVLKINDYSVYETYLFKKKIYYSSWFFYYKHCVFALNETRDPIFDKKLLPIYSDLTVDSLYSLVNYESRRRLVCIITDSI